MNSAGRTPKDSEVPKDASAMAFVTRKPPKNARVVKSSAKTGTISRAAARAAVKALLAERAGRAR